MRFLVTSASGANGNGYGALLSFGPDGEFLGAFSNDARIADPRGLSVDPSGTLIYLNSGDDRVLVLELSPLDLTVAPDGNIVVASEWPFGAEDAVTSVREYDPATGRLVRVLTPERSVGFRRPRGLRFGPGGHLYCAGEDHVVAFDFGTGGFVGLVVQLTRLNGQALVLIP
jgi:DNA-binding beta-propeller fold protein YncE